MPVMDEFKQQRDEIKQMSLKGKLTYFWDYYKWWVIGGLAFLFFAIYMINDLATKKEEALMVAMVNYQDKGAATYNVYAPFFAYAPLDSDKYDITLNTSMTMGLADQSYTAYSATESLTVYMYAGDLDLVLTNDSVFRTYAYRNDFLPLQDYLTPEQMEKYKDYFYYVDAAVVREYSDAMATATQEYDKELPGEISTDEMKEPIAIGICLDSSELLNENYTMLDETANKQIVGLVANSSHTEVAVRFIEYLLEGTN